MTKLRISINPTRSDVPMSDLATGSFFQFPGSAEGNVYVITRICREHGTMWFMQLGQKFVYDQATPRRKMVCPLHMLSAEFEINEGRR